MIRITCDTCGTVKNPRRQNWILGYDLRFDNSQIVTRSISFYDGWDDSRILQRGAIHFCSPECKQAYVAAHPLRRKVSGKKTRHRRRKAA